MVADMWKALLIAVPLLVSIWNVQGQDPNSTTTSTSTISPTTLVPLPVIPSTTPAQIPTPVDTSTVSPDDSSFSCCYVQSSCRNCSEYINLNSITYCCPNCRGMVLVTDLVCKCTVPAGEKSMCRFKNMVVGNYDSLRPSYYSSDSNFPSGSAMLGVAAALTVIAGNLQI